MALIAVLTLIACESGAPPPPEQESDQGSVERENELTAQQRRAVEIYAAVIRRLVTKDHTFGGGASPFEHVYVLDGPRKGAGNPLKPEAPAEKHFSDEIKAALNDSLRKLPPIDFVARSQDARRGSGIDKGVKDNGVIVSVGPIIGRAGTVKVSNSLWCNGLCGQWQTYRVELVGGHWRVKGTVGPIAIS